MSVKDNDMVNQEDGTTAILVKEERTTAKNEDDSYLETYIFMARMAPQ